MASDTFLHAFGITLQVFLIDLLLSGDNAVMIALACRGLPPSQLQRAALFGIGAAIVLRILLTGAASIVMSVPILRLVGAIALVWVAIKLVLDQQREAAGARGASGARKHPASGFWPAVGTIIIADTVMSIDNVVALAAASQGSLFFLALGLLLSVPLLMFGSLFVTTLLRRYPILIRGGGAMLGWLAGDIAMADPLIAQDVSQQAPVLIDLVPILVAIFVLVESRVIERGRHIVAPPARLARPAARVAPGLEGDARIQTEPSIEDAVPLPPISSAPREEKQDDTVALPPVSPGPQAPHTRSWPRLMRTLPWLAAAGGIVVVGVFLTFARMPAPEGLGQFVCPDQATIYFRHGKDVVRMTSHAGTINGLMRFGRIDWGNYELATKTLGFLPPTEITYDDAKELRITGGRYVNIACGAR